MRFSTTRRIKLLSVLAALPWAASAQDLKLEGGPLELEHHLISVTSATTQKGFFEKALPRLVNPDNWAIVQGASTIRVREVTVDLKTQGIRLRFRPGAFRILDPIDIP